MFPFVTKSKGTIKGKGVDDESEVYEQGTGHQTCVKSTFAHTCATLVM